MKTRIAGLLLFLTFCALATGRNVVIINPTNKPVPIKNAGAPVALPTPTASPTSTPTPTPAGFDPTTIAGLKLWLKADALALSDGATVASWPDSSGSGNTLPSQSVAPSFVSPTYKTNVINGKPVVRFVSGIFRGPVTIDMTTGYTFFAVVNWAAGSGNRAALAFESSVGTQIQLRADGADLNLYQFDTGWHASAEAGGVNAGSFSVVTCGFDPVNSGGSSIWLWRNGTFKAAVFAAATAPIVDTNIAVESFVSGSPASLFTGDIAEVLVYNSTLSTTDRRNVDAYLGAKYGITIVPTLRSILEEIKDGAEQQPTHTP